MAQLGDAGFTGFIKSGLARTKAVLLFGSDDGLIAGRAAQIIAALSNDSDNKASVHTITDSELKQSPGGFLDEVLAISMFGGARCFVITSAGVNALAFLKAHLPALAPGDLVLLKAGNLPKTSALRKYFLSAPDVASMACYEASPASIRALIKDTLDQHNLNISGGDLTALAAMLGTSPARVKSEMAKLTAYCHGAQGVSLADIEACCGDEFDASLDRLVDCALLGDTKGTLQVYRMVMEKGKGASGVLSAMQSHLKLLLAISLKSAGTRNPADAVKSHRPPVFFKRQQAVTRQVTRWRVENLRQMAANTFETMYRTRTNPAIEDEIVERFLLSVSHIARSAHK